MQPRTGEESANSPRRTTSLYQALKSSARVVSFLSSLIRSASSRSLRANPILETHPRLVAGREAADHRFAALQLRALEHEGLTRSGGIRRLELPRELLST